MIPPSGGNRMDGRILMAARVLDEEHVMEVGAPGPGGGDWLDLCCWRCGTADARQDSLGRMLCPPCRVEITDDGSTSDDPLAVVRGAYWHTHTLELCWRCLTESVNPDDEVGLCPACVTTLAAADTSSRQEPTGR